MRNKILLSWLVFVIVGVFLSITFAETEAENIYGLMDYQELKRVIEEKEDILKEKPNDVYALKILGIAYHNLSVIGKKGVSAKAFSILSKAYELAPEDYEILVYLGSAKTLLGRDATFPMTRLYQVNKGCRIIDEAISKAPDNIVVRLTRANNSLGIPSFFQRVRYAKEDMLYLLRLSEKEKEKFLPELLATIYYTLGEYHKEKEEMDKAREYWKKAVGIAPSSKDGLLAKKRIEVYKP